MHTVARRAVTAFRRKEPYVTLRIGPTPSLLDLTSRIGCPPSRPSLVNRIQRLMSKPRSRKRHWFESLPWYVLWALLALSLVLMAYS